MLKRTLLGGVMALALAGPAAADYETGLEDYERGNYAEALEQFEASAPRDERSLYMLGRMYAEGEGTMQDYVRAHAYYNLAAAGGDERASRQREELERRMTAEQIAEAQEEARALDRRYAGRDGGPTAGRSGAAESYSLGSLQETLNELGYEAGPADGVMGSRTREAISQFQADTGLAVTGEPSAELYRRARQRLAGGSDLDRPSDGRGSAGRREGRRDMPGQAFLYDDFEDGDYTSQPAWRVRAGDFSVRRGALYSRVEPVLEQGSAEDRGRTDAGEVGRELLGAVLQGALGDGEATSETEQAMIAAATPIDDAFHMRLELTSYLSEGRILFGPYQEAPDEAGYRLAYASGDRPSFELLSLTPRGAETIASSDRMISLEDGRPHVIEWWRSADGEMVVEVDGREAMSVRDRSLERDFDGFTLLNAGGEYGIDQISIEPSRG